MIDQRLKVELSRLDKNALYAIAKRLKMRSYRHLPKGELIDLLINSNSSEDIRKVELIPTLRTEKPIRRFLRWRFGQGIIYSAAVASIIAAVFTVLSYVKPSTAEVGKNTNTDQKSVGSEGLTAVNTKMDTPSSEQTPPVKQPIRSGSAGRSNVSSLLSRARKLYNQRRFHEAIGLCDQALRISPTSSEARKLKDQVTHTMITLNNDNP